MTIRRNSIGFHSVVIFLLLVFFLNTFSIGRDHVYSTQSFILLLFGVVFALFLGLMRKQSFSITARHCPLAMYVFLLPFMLYGSFVSNASEIAGAINNIVFQLSFIIFLIFTALFFKPSREAFIEGYVKLSIVFSIMASMVALQLFLTQSALFGPFRIEGMRWPQLYGWFQSPNFYVNAVALSLFAALYKLKNGLRASNVFVVLFFLLMLVLSGSKGGILATVLAVITFFLLFLFSRPSSKTFLLLAKIASLALVGLFLLSIFVYFYLWYIQVDLQWLTRSVVRLQSAATGTGRLDLWKNSFEMLSQANVFQLLFGYGNNAIIQTYGASTHSAHIKILVEYGLTSFLLIWSLFFFIVGWSFKLAKSNPSLSFLVLSSVCYVWYRSFFNAGLFSFSIVGAAFIFFIFIYSVKPNKVS